MLVRASPNSDVTQMGKSLSEMQATWVRYLGQEDTLEKKWQPTPVFLPVENPVDRGAWWTTVHGVVAKSWTRLSD